jgi:DNA transformation protein
MSGAGAELAALSELFAAFGPVTLRRMFGGIGIYADGVMFALSYDGTVYLKTDDKTAASFRQQGSEPFTYTAKNGRRAVMSYWTMPDNLYDDGEELARWAREALAVAVRAQAGKRPRR